MPSVIPPFPLRLAQRPPRRLSPLFFDHRNFFVVPFGQVDCDGGKFLDVDYYGNWVFLLCAIPPRVKEKRKSVLEWVWCVLLLLRLRWWG